MIPGAWAGELARDGLTALSEWAVGGRSRDGCLTCRLQGFAPVQDDELCESNTVQTPCSVRHTSWRLPGRKVAKCLVI